MFQTKSGKGVMAIFAVASLIAVLTGFDAGQQQQIGHRGEQHWIQSLKVSARQQQQTGEREQQHLIQSLDGRSLFQAYCASCHGINGTGNGPAASVLKQAPPDLTRIRERNRGNFPSARMEKIISGEEIPTAAHGSRVMPIWGPIFSQIAWDQDLGKVRIYNLARYLESIQKK